jgi:hypothetical protein
MQSDILTLAPTMFRPDYAGLQHEEFMMAETRRRCRTHVIGILASLALVAGGFTASATAQDSSTPDYQAIVASPDRSDADRQTDKRREPVKMLAFTGVKPGMKVLDMEAGAGYSTECWRAPSVPAA